MKGSTASPSKTYPVAVRSIQALSLDRVALALASTSSVPNQKYNRCLHLAPVSPHPSRTLDPQRQPYPPTRLSVLHHIVKLAGAAFPFERHPIPTIQERRKQPGVRALRDFPHIKLRMPGEERL